MSYKCKVGSQEEKALYYANLAGCRVKKQSQEAKKYHLSFFMLMLSCYNLIAFPFSCGSNPVFGLRLDLIPVDHAVPIVFLLIVCVLTAQGVLLNWGFNRTE